MAILETAASRAAGTGGYRNGKGSGFAKNVSLTFVCASVAGVLWFMEARDLHVAALTMLRLTGSLVDLPKLGFDIGRF